MIFVAHRRLASTTVAAALLAACAARVTQTPPAPAAATAAPSPEMNGPTINVGSNAPDFELRGATRYGLLANLVHLSDYRGQTVVVAFFYKARTKG